jgi:hypothetical protein
MDKEKIKLILRNIEILIDNLKAEIYSDVSTYNCESTSMNELDYDEIFEDSE